MCIDFYVYLLWASELSKEGEMYFLPASFIKDCIDASHEVMSEAQRNGMLRLLGLKQSKNPKRPVSGIVHKGNHYFVVVMDVDRGSAYVYGKDRNSQERRWDLLERDFKEWNGDRLWKWTTDLFGWEPRAREVLSVGHVDWLQVSAYQNSDVKELTCIYSRRRTALIAALSL